MEIPRNTIITVNGIKICFTNLSLSSRTLASMPPIINDDINKSENSISVMNIINVETLELKDDFLKGKTGFVVDLTRQGESL